MEGDVRADDERTVYIFKSIRETIVGDISIQTQRWMDANPGLSDEG